MLYLRATNKSSFRGFTRFADLGFNGDRSSMVELQFVVLAVAGSSPVGRPPLLPLKRFSPSKVWADCGQLAIRKAISDDGNSIQGFQFGGFSSQERGCARDSSANLF
jgi:hypothetical protein